MIFLRSFENVTPGYMHAQTERRGQIVSDDSQ